MIVDSEETLAAFCAMAGGARLTPAQLEARRCDVSLLVHESGRAAARCSLWWSNVPSVSGERVGLLGHYVATSSDAAARLFEQAEETLRSHGCTLALGPIDGSTWRDYRFVTERGDAPPFFLEPDHPAEWVEQIRGAGFAPYLEYVSARVDDVQNHLDPELDDIEQRLERHGIRTRFVDVQEPERETRAIYPLAMRCFQPSALFTPVSEQEYVDLAAPLIKVAVPELVILAERGGEPVGYFAAVPDLCQQARGEHVDRVVLKVGAVHPDCQGLSLGRYFFGRIHREAAARGFRTVIHSTMAAGNRSRRLSANTGTLCRRYALFSKRLAAPS